jgi:hypothetical protein
MEAWTPINLQDESYKLNGIIKNMRTSISYRGTQNCSTTYYSFTCGYVGYICGTYLRLNESNMYSVEL